MRLQCYFHSPPHIWSFAYSLRPIGFISVVHTAVITAHYLPVDRVGQQQQPYHTVATGDSRAQRSTETLKMADAGEPSSLADAPVLCRAVRGDEGEGEEIRVDGSKSLNAEMERFEPNTFCTFCVKHQEQGAEYYMNIYHAKKVFWW